MGEAPTRSGDSLPWHPQALGELGHRHRELQSCSVNTEGRGCECLGALGPTTGRGLGRKGAPGWVAMYRGIPRAGRSGPPTALPQLCPP